MKMCCAALAVVGALALPGRALADDPPPGPVRTAPLAPGGLDWPEVTLPKGKGEPGGRGDRMMVTVGGVTLGLGLAATTVGAIVFAASGGLRSGKGAQAFVGGVMPMVGGGILIVIGAPVLAVGLSSRPDRNATRPRVVPSLALGLTSARIQLAF